LTTNVARAYIIAEVGINANGSVDTAKKLIDMAKKAGCDAVKFQKRDCETVYTKEELDVPRESPWGTTNREQKYGLEFSMRDYATIHKHCNSVGIEWFFSAWDLESQKAMGIFDCPYNKIASAMLGNLEFLHAVAAEGKHTFISTGMSTAAEIREAIAVFKSHGCDYTLMLCTSTYPMKTEEAHLANVQTLMTLFDCPIGFSDHSTGIILSCAAVAMGAVAIERHITLDRSAYGSDQAASLEYGGLSKMVAYIRAIEDGLGDRDLKGVLPSEKPIREKLRWYDSH